MASFTDTDNLKSNQYKDASNLNARIAIYAYSTNETNWYSWVYDRLALKPQHRLLEAGAGNGAFWAANQERWPKEAEIILSDVSKGMLDEAKEKINDARFRLEEADIQSLPYSNGTFDRVLANHMLYHVPDIEDAVKEVERVLRPKGRFVATTNSIEHMAELYKIMEMFDSKLHVDTATHIGRFSMENGKQLLESVFSNVMLDVFRGELVIHEPQPVVNYILSMYMVASLPTMVQNDDTRQELNSFVQSIIDHDGAIRIRTCSCAFICDRN